MKNFILILTFVITTLTSFTQTTLGMGYVNDDNSLIYESKVELTERFKFKKSADNEQIACIVSSTNDGIDDILLWDIINYSVIDGAHVYKVTDADLHVCILIFNTQKKEVIIIDTDDGDKFSSMEGGKLKYSGL